MRKLAERSVEAAKEIGEVVRQVQEDTGDAVDAAKASAVQTKEGIALADKAGLALRSIIESVTRVEPAHGPDRDRHRQAVAGLDGGAADGVRT